MQDYSNQYVEQSALQTNKVLRNTYMLLSITLAWSAICALGAMMVGLGRGPAMIMSLAAIALVWFVLPRTANSSAGILTVFAFTGLLGGSLGPMLTHYLSMSAGGSIVFQALAGTALIFMSLSAYVLTTKKDFSFMGGFLFVGIMMVVVASLGLMIASFFGFYMPLAHLVISGIVVLLMSGFILFDTSRIINGGETNYVLATVSLYLNIYNLFTSLLHLIGAMSDD